MPDDATAKCEFCGQVYVLPVEEVEQMLQDLANAEAAQKKLDNDEASSTTTDDGETSSG